MGSGGTVTSGADWFVNWADFPSVVPSTRRPGPRTGCSRNPAASIPTTSASRSATMPGRVGRRPCPARRRDTDRARIRVAVSRRRWRAGRLARRAPHRRWTRPLGRQTGGRYDLAQRHDRQGRPARWRGPGTRRPRLRLLPDRCCAHGRGARRRLSDRGTREVRDIALVRHGAGGWSEPVLVHGDGWRIDACQSTDRRGRAWYRVGVAWFTAPDVPRVRIAFSEDAGRSFSPPVEVASGNVAGRVDVVLLEDGTRDRELAAGISGRGEIRAQPFDRAVPWVQRSSSRAPPCTAPPASRKCPRGRWPALCVDRHRRPATGQDGIRAAPLVASRDGPGRSALC